MFGGSLFGGIYTSRAVLPDAATRLDAQSARRQAREAAVTVSSLEDRVDQLTLACMAMWSLLREKTGLTEEELLERIKQIDLADGEEDGKIRAEVTECSQCGRKLSRRHKQCMYCGSERLNPTGFDGAK